MTAKDYRIIRRYAYEMLFSLDFNNEIDPELFFSLDYEPDEMDEELLPELPKSMLNDEQKEMILKKVNLVKDNLASIDEKISELSEGWKIHRIGKEELTAMRLAVAEIVYDGLDKAIVIDEAVRLVKLFGGEDSYKYVNGVLGKI